MSPILPALSVLFAVLATAVPWGLPADATFILPLVVVMMVFCWRIIPDAVLPLTACMLLGLLTDVMSGGPLGFFALMALIAASVGGRFRSVDRPARAVASVAGLDRARRCARRVRLAAGARSISSAGSIGGRSCSATLASIALFPVVLRGLGWIRRGSIGPAHSAMFRSWT